MVVEGIDLGEFEGWMRLMKQIAHLGTVQGAVKQRILAMELPRAAGLKP